MISNNIGPIDKTVPEEILPLITTYEPHIVWHLNNPISEYHRFGQCIPLMILYQSF